MIFDLHCDTLLKLIDVPEGGDLAKNCWHVDLHKLKKSKYILQDFAIFVDLKEQQSAYERYRDMLRVFQGQLEKYPELMFQIRSYADLNYCKKNKKLGALLSIEEGGVLGGNIFKLEEAFYDGIRLITLTWNYPNELGYPNKVEGYDKGLTSKGWEFVEYMQENGMIVDTSHLNDQGTKELLVRAKKPIMASHSNARHICNHARNLPDYLIRKFGEKGGLIGLNFSADFVGSKPINLRCDFNNARLILKSLSEDEYNLIKTGQLVYPLLDNSREFLKITLAKDLARHAQHIINLGGEDVLALGTDFDGIEPNLEIYDASEMDKLIVAFSKAGLPSRIIEKICWRNADSFFAETLVKE